MRFSLATFILSVALFVIPPDAMALTITVLPAADGFGEDDPIDGVFDLVNTTSNNRPVNHSTAGFNQGVHRSTFEFELPTIPGGEVITSVTFQFEGVVQFGDLGPEITLIHGYAGDGSITVGDFVESNLLGSISISVASANDPFLETLDVTSFIEGLYSSTESHAGLLVQLQNESAPQHGLDLIGTDTPDPARFPKLIIQTVPEPSTALLLASGLAALALRRRRAIE